MTDDSKAVTDLLGGERPDGRPPTPAIRLNTLKVEPDSARQTWPGWYGWRVEAVPFCHDGWKVTPGERSLSRTLEYRMGCYYIQDTASMLPVELFGPLGSAPLVLDMAAAPGGKTTHLACKTGDQGLIVANDISARRAGALLSNLRRWGTTSAAVTALPGERLGRWLPETFDAVLLDAPCSGENLRAEGGSRGRQVSDRERAALHDRQVRLLLAAFAAARIGGEVVYATCTVAPLEDEAVLDDFLGRAGRAAEISRPDDMADLPGGLGGDAGRVFDARTAAAIRLWPEQYDSGGFFAARIQKRDGIDAEQEPLPGWRGARGGFARLAGRERAQVAAALREGYGFDLDALLDERVLDAWGAGRLVHAIPRALGTSLDGLPVKAAGMLIGERNEAGFVPSHELVSRFKDRFAAGWLHIADDQLDGWLAGGEIKGLTPPADLLGQVALLADARGRFVGRGRVSAARIRNMLPAGF